jgi:hypothetical protein
MIIQKRDYEIFKEVYRWRCILGRHIKQLCGFKNTRTCDIRLKKLILGKYLQREKILYGTPSIYTLGHSARILTGVNKNKEHIRIDQIKHDITVLDVACAVMKKSKLKTSQITTDKELHSLDGFGVRKHRPDFVVKNKTGMTAMEIELTPKALDRLEKNVKDNYLNYASQQWFIPKDQKKIHKMLTDLKKKYDNMKIYVLEEVINE